MVSVFFLPLVVKGETHAPMVNSQKRQPDCGPEPAYLEGNGREVFKGGARHLG